MKIFLNPRTEVDGWWCPPSPTAVNKKILPLPKQAGEKSHFQQSGTILIPNFSWSWMFSANVQRHHRADVITGYVIKPCPWALLLEVTKAGLKHPHILLLPLLGRCESFPWSAPCASLLPLGKLQPLSEAEQCTDVGKSGIAFIRGESRCASGEISVLCFGCVSPDWGWGELEWTWGVEAAEGDHWWTELPSWVSFLRDLCRCFQEPSSPAPLAYHWCQLFPALRPSSASREQHILFCCILNCWSVLWWLTCCEGCQIQPLPWERAASPGRGNLRRRGLVEQGKESWLLSNVVGSSQLLYDLYSKP